MPTFYVTIEEITCYDLTVEAKDADSAADLAEKLFSEAPDTSEFKTRVHSPEVSNVEMAP